MSREVSPNCTDFCTGSGQHLGHPVTTEADKQRMIQLLGRHGVPWINGIPDQCLAMAVDALYREGFGYNAIADLAGKPHEEIYRVITEPLG